ncbi:MAG: helix-turn-helix domain-containing protein [Corynebacterium sp.]|jgi:transcriptional regulator with XRE-family HTH domain|uniref:helix-turn-helix domain-containing protein n=1 Tax=unclassified Corynebacterium TaxID=2624378 RepID=UPI0009FB6CAF|nr:helix-turn-helix transcriptional regulator [Corynebacterium sp. CNJ-954]
MGGTRKRTPMSVEERATVQILREKRIEAGISQIEVGRRTDMTRGRLAKIESGCAPLSVTDLFLLCRFYVLDPAVIVGAATMRAEELR